MDLMTVPTNNEEAEALAKLIRNFWNEAIDSRPASESDEDVLARRILAARRPPVSGDNAELIAKAANWAWFHRHDPEGSVDTAELLDRLSAALSASQPREAAPSDTDRGRLDAIHELLSSLDLDGPTTREGTAWGSILREAKELSRTSHPVQVEVTKGEVAPDVDA